MNILTIPFIIFLVSTQLLKSCFTFTLVFDILPLFLCFLAPHFESSLLPFFKRSHPIHAIFTSTFLILPSPPYPLAFEIDTNLRTIHSSLFRIAFIRRIIHTSRALPITTFSGAAGIVVVFNTVTGATRCDGASFGEILRRVEAPR